MPDKIVPIAVGNLRGTQYTFDRGGGLPMHVHGEADNHITVVQKGRVKIVAGDDTAVLSPPDIYNFVAGVPHEIEALDDGTVIFNILKSGGG